MLTVVNALLVMGPALVRAISRGRYISNSNTSCGSSPWQGAEPHEAGHDKAGVFDLEIGRTRHSIIRRRLGAYRSDPEVP